eukprot:scaffold115205_cov57-Cyclotella_meneghiniana.AAC.1
MKVAPLFHSPHRLLVGDAPLVGVLDLPSSPSNHERPPIRLFFPAAIDSINNSKRKVKPARYFVNNRVSYVLQGLAHIALARHTTRLYRYIYRPLAWMISLVFPARFLKIPHTALVNDYQQPAISYSPLTTAQLDNDKAASAGQSLVVFSHGLTGTGEENALFCTALAKRGYVVACIHHRDGSSSRVPMPDGTCKFYDHLPSGEDYNPVHRLEQVSYRAREFLYATNWLLGETVEPLQQPHGSNNNDDDYNCHPILQQIRPTLDKNKVIASGFSYGSTTCSLAATINPHRYQCAVFLDGWFHVDYSSKGYEYNFPPEAFGQDWPDKANIGNEKSHLIPSKEDGLAIPSVFINSLQFANYDKLYGATRTLADRINTICIQRQRQPGREEGGRRTSIPETKLHVIPNTKHQNFCDVGFWLPKALLRRGVGRQVMLGEADVVEAAKEILNLTVEFLKQF